MRKNLSLVVVAGLVAVGASSILPAPTSARPAPVEVRQDSCGRTNVYVNGQPVFTYTPECFPDPS